MRFFSKFVFICNICFVISVAIRLIENSQGNKYMLIPNQAIEATFVVLGYTAIIFNFFFVLLSIYWLVKQHWTLIPRTVLFFNLIMFPIQIWYFFFSTF